MAYCQLIFLAILSPVNDHHLSGGKVATVPFALPHGQLVVSVGDYCAHWPGLGAIGLAAVSLVCVHSFASPSSIRPCSGRHTVSLAIRLDLAVSGRTCCSLTCRAHVHCLLPTSGSCQFGFTLAAPVSIVDTMVVLSKLKLNYRVESLHRR